MHHRSVLRSVTCGAAVLLCIGLAGCGTAQPPAERAAEETTGSASAETLVRIGDASRSGGNLGAALSLYRRAVEKAPRNADALLAYAQGLSEAGAISEAAEIWNRLIDVAPDSVDARLSYGGFLLAVGQPALAAEQFRAAIAVAALAELPEPRGHNGLGISLDLLGQPDAAQAAYRDGLALDPENDSLRSNLALSLAMTGQADALALLRPIAERPGASDRARLNLALVYGLLGDGSTAAGIARQVLDEVSVQQNLAAYQEIRGLASHADKAAAVGAFISAR